MTAHAALTAAELLALSGPTTVKGYLAVFQPAVRATAQINDPGGAITYPLTTLPVDTVSNTTDWTGAKTGSTCRITNGATGAQHYYRLRQPPTATTLYLMEMSSGDTGLMPDSGSTTGIWFVDNDVIEVFDRFDLWSALPYLSYGGGVFTYKEDYYTT